MDKHSVFIVWGDGPSEQLSRDSIVRYEFDTEKELAAFIKGMEETAKKNPYVTDFYEAYSIEDALEYIEFTNAEALGDPIDEVAADECVKHGLKLYRGKHGTSD